MSTEEQWARIEPLLPPLKGSMGRHLKWSQDGTWVRVLAPLHAGPAAD